MEYTQSYHFLKQFFNPGKVKSAFSGSDIECYWTGFESENISILAEERDLFLHKKSVLTPFADDSIIENKSFTYPILKRTSSPKNAHPIILLHGLNERSWNKYLVWAYYLVQHTERPVILFPIAFHMNRSPEAWSNPRTMTSLLLSRRKRIGEAAMSTFANVALSERLCEDPLRFFTSGQQSAADLVQLTQQLKDGQHPLFTEGTNVDIFAYSIGAFLAQVLMLGNPEGLYSNSRLFLFCGGAFFDQMDGVSKLIMDQEAFNRLRGFYINELNGEIERSGLLKDSMKQTPMGQSFLAMLSVGNLKAFREDTFLKMKKQIKAIALLKDKVIPAKGITETMNRFSQLDIMDFGYAYSHENPFPLFEGKVSSLVDKSFDRVFSKAADFLQ